MGIDPKQLNDRQIGMIGDPQERKQTIKRRGLGKTCDDVVKEATFKVESELQDRYLSFLARHEIPYVRANPKKKSTIKKGCPDVTVTAGEKYGYKSFYAEFKMPGNKLSPDQEQDIAYRRRCGCKVFVWYNYDTAIRETITFLGFATQPN